MNNEPVAWMRQDFDGEWIEVNAGKGTPLYTHPAKTLTDKEIKSVWKKMVCPVHITKSELDFAKAILRKAQEK